MIISFNMTIIAIIAHFKLLHMQILLKKYVDQAESVLGKFEYTHWTVHVEHIDTNS